MNYEPVDLCELAARNLKSLIDQNGPAIHAYVLHRAEELEREYPWNDGLVRFAEQQLGPAATVAARRDIRILLGEQKTTTTRKNPQPKERRHGL